MELHQTERYTTTMVVTGKLNAAWQCGKRCWEAHLQSPVPALEEALRSTEVGQKEPSLPLQAEA